MNRETRAGAAAAVTAFLVWGVSGLFYKWFGAMPTSEILSHRVLWSAVICLGAVAATRRLAPLRAVCRVPRQLALLLVSAAMISINWLLFIWSVGHGHALEASMGYFIYPLVSVLLGAALLGERLNARRIGAVAVVAVGVALQVARLGEVPWIALGLAGSFAAYALLRKVAMAEALVGLTVETVALAPLAAIYLIGQGGGAFAQGEPTMIAMLLSTGPMTALPLLLFAFGARRLRLSTLGLMQYVNPTTQMLVAVLAFGEPFASAHMVTFACIWLGLALYSLDAARPRN
ncbi:MAG: EamA family transporter RarD [Alphaproteobacteria bacterium]|nr:EamA family transporter RarD [Alphaproteobacteria bacterium]MBF0391843.1 EamA family transporter RarD [Alphaproteobacteria bacterium]